MERTFDRNVAETADLDGLIAFLADYRSKRGNRPVLLAVRPEDVDPDLGTASLSFAEEFAWYEGDYLILGAYTDNPDDPEGTWRLGSAEPWTDPDEDPCPACPFDPVGICEECAVAREGQDLPAGFRRDRMLWSDALAYS